jgi:hypothetical protein
MDLDLAGTVLRGNGTDEELFCFLWCYTLDRNHAFKVRTSRCLLDVHLPPTFADLYPTYPNIAELLLIYLDLARVQDIVISHLPDSSVNHHVSTSSLYNTGEYMLLQMQYIQQRMNQVSSIPPYLCLPNILTRTRSTPYPPNGKASTARPKCPP